GLLYLLTFNFFFFVNGMSELVVFKCFQKKKKVQRKNKELEGGWPVSTQTFPRNNCGTVVVDFCPKIHFGGTSNSNDWIKGGLLIEFFIYICIFFFCSLSCFNLSGVMKTTTNPQNIQNCNQCLFIAAYTNEQKRDKTGKTENQSVTIVNRNNQTQSQETKAKLCVATFWFFFVSILEGEKHILKLFIQRKGYEFNAISLYKILYELYFCPLRLNLYKTYRFAVFFFEDGGKLCDILQRMAGLNISKKYVDIGEIFQVIAFCLNVPLLLVWFWQVFWVHKTKCCKLPAAFGAFTAALVLTSIGCVALMILNSLYHAQHQDINRLQFMCSGVVIFSLVCKCVAKYCIWFFSFIRGQTLIYTLYPSWTYWTNKAPIFGIIFKEQKQHTHISLLGENERRITFFFSLGQNRGEGRCGRGLKKERKEYIESTQEGFHCILSCVLLGVYWASSSNTSTCMVQIPGWFFIVGVMTGDFLYGVGFVYIFWKSFNSNVNNTLHLTGSIAHEIKEQTYTHMVAYMTQTGCNLCHAVLCAVACFSKRWEVMYFLLLAWEWDLLLVNVLVFLLCQEKIRIACHLLRGKCDFDLKLQTDLDSMHLFSSFCPPVVSDAQTQKLETRDGAVVTDPISQQQQSFFASKLFWFPNQWPLDIHVMARMFAILQHNVEKDIPKMTEGEKAGSDNDAENKMSKMVMPVTNETVLPAMSTARQSNEMAMQHKVKTTDEASAGKSRTNGEMNGHVNGNKVASPKSEMKDASQVVIEEITATMMFDHTFASGDKANDDNQHGERKRKNDNNNNDNDDDDDDDDRDGEDERDLGHNDSNIDECQVTLIEEDEDVELPKPMRLEDKDKASVTDTSMRLNEIDARRSVMNDSLIDGIQVDDIANVVMHHSAIGNTPPMTRPPTITATAPSSPRPSAGGEFSTARMSVGKEDQLEKDTNMGESGKRRLSQQQQQYHQHQYQQHQQQQQQQQQLQQQQQQVISYPSSHDSGSVPSARNQRSGSGLGSHISPSLSGTFKGINPPNTGHVQNDKTSGPQAPQRSRGVSDDSLQQEMNLAEWNRGLMDTYDSSLRMQELQAHQRVAQSHFHAKQQQAFVDEDAVALSISKLHFFFFKKKNVDQLLPNESKPNSLHTQLPLHATHLHEFPHLPNSFPIPVNHKIIYIYSYICIYTYIYIYIFVKKTGHGLSPRSNIPVEQKAMENEDSQKTQSEQTNGSIYANSMNTAIVKSHQNSPLSTRRSVPMPLSASKGHAKKSKTITTSSPSGARQMMFQMSFAPQHGAKEQWDPPPNRSRLSDGNQITDRSSLVLDQDLSQEFVVDVDDDEN
ncbi:myb domain-containing protein, partial [Reticulomyxa filosa]